MKSIADAKKVKFRIAEAAVNQMTYRAWGFNPVVMPWPDVAVALKQGVITGLDHTPIVCYVTKKFEVAKYYTQLNYAQGLFIWIFNRAWFERLPEDLQKIFVEVIHDVARKAREETRRQEKDSIRAAGKKTGLPFTGFRMRRCPGCAVRPIRSIENMRRKSTSSILTTATGRKIS